jgi:hypothetical protein
MLTRLLIELQKHSQIASGWLSPISFGLWSESGKWRAGGEHRIGQRSRSETPRADPQTEAAASAAARTNVARDERAWSAAERAWSRGGQGRPEAREAERKARWSRRIVLCCLGFWYKQRLMFTPHVPPLLAQS